MILQRVPQVNSVWQGDSVKLSTTVDISVAVATDQGLITPIVQSAAYLSVDDISSKVKVSCTLNSWADISYFCLLDNT